MAQNNVSTDVLTALPEPRAIGSVAGPARELYIDRLRAVMTALVLFHHTAITYGGSGGWFWREHDTSSAPSSLLLTLFCATNQTYFMGFFFLLAGYFTPKSLERKGYSRFLVDRGLRLGLPLLAFILVLGPLTVAIAEWGDGNRFVPTLVALWNHKRVINGPLWFAEALLIFSLAYCMWRRLLGSPLVDTERVARPVPQYRAWLLAALATGAGALAIRQVVPTGENVYGLQLGYFSSYIVLFAAGIAAWRRDWLRTLNWNAARPWIWTMVGAWLLMPVSMVVVSTRHEVGKVSFSGGLSWTAIFYAFWEPFVAWGFICLWLLVFRARMNRSSRLWDWLNRRAYAVYILHPPVLVTIALLMHGWDAPAVVKFFVVGALTCVATWLVADPLVRLPGVRRVV